VARGEAIVVNAHKPLDVLTHQAVERCLFRPSWAVDPGADLHTSFRAGGRETGGCARGSPSDTCSATDKSEHPTLRGQARSTVQGAGHGNRRSLQGMSGREREQPVVVGNGSGRRERRVGWQRVPSASRRRGDVRDERIVLLGPIRSRLPATWATRTGTRKRSVPSFVAWRFEQKRTGPVDAGPRPSTGS
jgi:hypothetical protein